MSADLDRCGEWLTHRAVDGARFRHTDSEECPVCRGEVPAWDPLAEVERRWHQTVPPASVYGRSLTAIIRDVRDGGGS